MSWWDAATAEVATSVAPAPEGTDRGDVRMPCSALYAKVSEKWGCVWYRWDCLLEPASG